MINSVKYQNYKIKDNYNNFKTIKMSKLEIDYLSHIECGAFLIDKFRSEPEIQEFALPIQPRGQWDNSNGYCGACSI